jgi:predicted transcriptional regulator of viral defense system
MFKTMKLNAFFDKHPVFRYEEFAEFMKMRGITKKSSHGTQLNYHHKAGRLVHIRKSLYGVKPVLTSEEHHWIDPYLIAGKATEDSVIAYHSALELHGLAYTAFEEHTFLTRQPTTSFIYKEQRYRSTSFPKPLVVAGMEMNMVESIQREGIKINITNLERTIVDVLDRPDLSGGWEEIFRSFEHITPFNQKTLVEYLLLLNNSTTVSKVGFFLEQLPKYFAIEKNTIDQLLGHIPKQAHYMDREQVSGKYIEKWKLIVPVLVIEKKWEEPNVTDF